jgi:nuclear GTP-binding protein
MIRESPHGEKHMLLILNKIGISSYFLANLDLIPPETLNRWLVHLRRSFPVLPFHSNANPQFAHNNLPPKKLSLLLHNALKSRSTALKRTLSVGIIGFPNTGKSSIINALTRRLGQGDKVVTGSEAGVTKESRQIKLDNAIMLLDSPGIVFPTHHDPTAMVLLNVLPSSAVLDVRPAIDMILERLGGAGLLGELSSVYGIPEITMSEYVDTTTDFLVHVAKKRGRLGRGGVPMLDAAGKIVLNDWAMGRIKWWCEPPATTESTDEVAVVSEWAAAFDIDALLGDTDVEMKE